MSLIDDINSMKYRGGGLSEILRTLSNSVDSCTNRLNSIESKDYSISYGSFMKFSNTSWSLLSGWLITDSRTSCSCYEFVKCVDNPVLTGFHTTAYGYTWGFTRLTTSGGSGYIYLVVADIDIIGK